MSGVELLLLAVYVGYDEAQDLLHVLNAHQMGRSLGVLKEMYQANIRPLLVLQNNLPQSQQNPLGLFKRPIVLKQICDKYVFQLILVFSNFFYAILGDQPGVDSIKHHHPTMINLPMLAVNFLAQERVVKPV